MRGFTLLEVLLAIALFSIIGLATVQQITLIRNTKVASQNEAEAYNGIRSAITMVRSDLQQTFHVLYEDLGEEAHQSLQRSLPTAHTLFDGRKNQLIFTTLSHRNYYQGRKESEQSEISYFLQVKGRNKHSTLYKRESERIDEDLFQGGNVYTILDGISDLEFQYWDDKAGKWLDDWNSDYGNTRDRFPTAVKIKLAVLDSKGRETKVETSFKISFANNEATIMTIQ